MDLQTIGDKAVTSENACPPNNFRAYSPQIPDHSRPQPTTTGHRLRLEESWRTRVAMRGALPITCPGRPGVTINEQAERGLRVLLVAVALAGRFTDVPTREPMNAHVHPRSRACLTASLTDRSASDRDRTARRSSPNTSESRSSAVDGS
jgi:hypothetical protein